MFINGQFLSIIYRNRWGSKARLGIQFKTFRLYVLVIISYLLYEVYINHDISVQEQKECLTIVSLHALRPLTYAFAAIIASRTWILVSQKSFHLIQALRNNLRMAESIHINGQLMIGYPQYTLQGFFRTFFAGLEYLQRFRPRCLCDILCILVDN